MKKIILLAAVPFCLCSAQQVEPDDSWYMYLIEQGKQWVNERVIIESGDTTYYYYTYEIQGKLELEPEWDGGFFDACHYYTGSQIDQANDSIVCCFHEAFGISVNCINNYPYQKTREENRNILDLPIIGLNAVVVGKVLYYFAHWLPVEEVSWYLHHQTEPSILTSENLVVAEPIVLEGKNCQRIAYIGEQGDTLAYIVEGIGFDSRDMGDLLTPFTRKPDPNADYQEWCGLSHVIKDGKIIYKGMRYREGAFEGINEVVTEQPRHPLDANYYNLMGQPVGKDVPTAPGIYIHHGQKICVSRTP